MSLISDMANQLVSWVLRLVFGLFALAFALGLLAAGRIQEIDRRYGPRGAKTELEEELADLKARGGAPP